MQMTEIAIREVQSQHLMPSDINLFNPQENITYGVLLFEYYLKSCGSVKKALICYNGGYMALLRYKAGGMEALPEETRFYVPKVLNTMRNLDPMFSRILPERRERDYLETAIDAVFYDLYGIGESSEQVVFGPGMLPN